MPLSENEQRLLEQMEKALYAEDPKFASTMRGSVRSPGAVSRMILGGVAVLAGLGVLVLGVAQANVLIGVAGFILMLVGTVFTFSTRRRKTAVTGTVNPDGSIRPAQVGSGQAKSVKSAKGKQARSSFMQRMEQRWDRRRDER